MQLQYILEYFETSINVCGVYICFVNSNISNPCWLGYVAT